MRRIVTPTVVGTVMMILAITLASVVFGLLDDASEAEAVAAPLTALATLVIVAALALRGSGLLRLWAPMIGIVGGCAVAAMFGIYSVDRVVHAPWIGLPQSAPGLGLDFGLSFWTLLPGFLFLGLIISIQANGAGIAVQRVSWRDDRAVDFRQVQRTLAGTGVSNLMAGLASRPGPRFDSGAATDRPSGARPAGPPPRWPPTTPGTAPDPPTPAAIHVQPPSTIGHESLLLAGSVNSLCRVWRFSSVNQAHGKYGEAMIPELARFGPTCYRNARAQPAPVG